MSSEITPPESPPTLDVIPGSDVRKPPHPMALAVATLMHTARDIEECLAHDVPHAIERHEQTLDNLGKDVQRLKGRSDIGDKAERGAIRRTLFDSVQRMERWALSDPGGTLTSAVFLRLFSAYDTFSGDILRALFSKKREMFFRVGGEVKLVDVLKAGDLEQFKEGVLAEYVDTFRRMGYVDQFKTLERLTELDTLTAFKRWPSFIEAAQRRNLVAHNGGVVSEQYLSVCRGQKVALPAELKVGDRLLPDAEYLRASTRLVMEVAFKLAQTVWRKCVPEDLAAADSHLHHVGYQALQLQEWEWAAVVGEFANELPRHSDEQSRLIAMINWAIAAKCGGYATLCEQLLKKVDWSAKLPEFRMAVAVLSDDFPSAAALMQRIGKKGDLIVEEAYHTWPLFRDFRASAAFVEAFESVYGHPFVQDLKGEASPLEEAAAGRSQVTAPAEDIAAHEMPTQAAPSEDAQTTPPI